ncbi:MAG: DUF3857 domain-containing protein [Bacteroidales bacterium]|nr:DUF3857 domain-containing protein [Bacteroidales bacterium]
MKKILFLATLLSVLHSPFSTLRAQQPDAIFKQLRYEWTINADGTSDYHYRHEVQILRNRALTAYADKGETFVVYNPDLEELTVNEVYTLQLDGTRIDMPQNAFVYQLPSECADCGRFNHMRELAMVHTGMELGCRIIVDYTIHRRYNLLQESIPLQRECPVEKLEIVVNNSSNFEVKYDTYGEDYLSFPRNTKVDMEYIEGVRSSTETRTYTNIPQAPAEPNMPADIIPTLHIYNGTPQHTPAFDQKPFSEASDVIGQLMNGRNAQENITNIRNYVVDNIHLNDIHPSHLGYVHSTPFEVWASGCGTATDKAVFLAAVLNNEGYTARVIGEDYDQVGVMIDTVEYRLDIRSKAPMEVNGEAKDEMATYELTSTVDVSPYLDTLEDGFFHLRAFFPLPGEPSVNATSLPLQRTTPLVASACDLRSDLTYTLPKGLKMVGGEAKQELDFPGIGSMQVSVKQSGKKIRVVRNLKIDHSTIKVEEYTRFRQLLAAWQTIEYLSILLRQK